MVIVINIYSVYKNFQWHEEQYVNIHSPTDHLSRHVPALPSPSGKQQKRAL